MKCLVFSDFRVFQFTYYFFSGSSFPPVSIFHSDLPFCFSNRRDIQLSPCDRSVAHNSVGLNDVLNDGRRQGIVRKYWKTEIARSKICRLEIAKSIFQLFQQCLNLAPNIKDMLATRNLKYSDLKSASHSQIEDKVLKTFLPSSETRLERRKKLDQFPINENKVFATKQKVILLNGTQGDPKPEDSGGFFQVLRNACYDVRKIPVLKTEFCNQVCTVIFFFNLRFMKCLGIIINLITSEQIRKLGIID